MRSREEGMTLVEVTVAMGLLATVAALFFPLLVSSSRAVRGLEQERDRADALRVGMASIDRELRSAVCVAEPAVAGEPGSTLRFTTLSGNRLHETTYRIVDGALQREVTGEAAALVVSGLDEASRFERLATTRASVRVELHAARSSAGSDEGPSSTLARVLTARNGWRPC